MQPLRLQEVESIFHAALEVAPEHVGEFLRERCGGDESLRREVEGLLAAHRQAGEFIGTPIATLDARLFEEDEPDRLIGRTIGHWEILKHIGSGGMGAVYLARRADRQYEQQVALKIIKRGMDTDAVLRRFRNERQILAGLDHPNIARLLDGDTTADGLPYFVMDYVEGLPIDEYCDRHGLPVRQRLELFRQVCAAVSYAHRHAVIHRDLKPSNILVSVDGVPKLLDFGIARLVQPGATPEAAATLIELRVMTPEYASPEQVRGEPVTTASDVYSLGVVLYRLLTGRLPYRVSGTATQDLGRTITDAAAPRPSKVSAERRLRGDLDNIVLMALRKEAERRYPSVEQFSEDIRRHLESLPVLARRDTLVYRTGKFVRRNMAVTAAGVLVVLSLVGGIVATSWQAQRARAQEAIAQAEKERAERRFNEVRSLARSVLFDYHDAIKELPGATPVRERLVKDALTYLDSLAREAGGDRELQREVAAAYDRVGDVRGQAYSAASLGDTAGAKDSYLKALRIREALVAADPQDTQSRIDLAGSYVKLGRQLTETQESALGVQYLHKAVALYRQISADQPDSIAVRQELAAAYNNLGSALEFQGDMTGAEEIHRQALALRESLVAAEPGEPRHRRHLAVTHINLGRALFLKGDVEGGLQSNRQALALCEALLDESADNVAYRRLLANTYQNDGDYRAALGDVAGALRSFRLKLVLDERSVADDPKNAVARGDLAYSHQRIGYLLGTSGRYAEASDHYQKALATIEQLLIDSPSSSNGRLWSLVARAGAAEMHAKLGNRATAIAESTKVLALLSDTPWEARSGDRLSASGYIYMHLGSTYAALAVAKGAGSVEQRERWRQARDMYRRGEAIWKEMEARGLLTRDVAGKPREAAAAIARCDQALSGDA